MVGTSEDLYERDFYAWTRRQASELRRWAATRPNLDLDLAHIAEEIEGLGKEQRNALRSWAVRKVCEEIQGYRSYLKRPFFGTTVHTKISFCLQCLQLTHQVTHIICAHRGI